MSIFKRGEIWWIQIRQGRYKPAIRRSAGTTKRREALEIERQLRASLRENADHLHQQVYTFGDAMVLWLQDGAPDSMLSHARNVRRYLQDVPLATAHVAAAAMARTMLLGEHNGKPLSKLTVNRRLAVVRRVLNLAHKKYGMLALPTSQMIEQYSEAGTAREIFLTRAEMVRLLAGMERDVTRDITLLAVNTGLRRSELFRLTPRDWQPPYIILTSRTKSGKPRNVPVIEELHPLLDDLPFPTTMWYLRQDFERSREKMKRPDIRFHDLRHTYASWLVTDPAVPLTVLRDLLGHSSLMVTSKYAHLRGGHASLVESVLGQKSANRESMWTQSGHTGDETESGDKSGGGKLH